MNSYLWHGERCILLVRAPFRRRIKRNCLVRLDSGRLLVVPWRALRRSSPTW